MKYHIKERRRKTEPVKVTRIELKHSGRTKTITLEYTDPKKLSKFLKDCLSRVVKTLKMEIPITESPLGHIKKCRIQVYESSNSSVTVKSDFKSFTCYGIDHQEAFDHILAFINQS